ncbi:hypothetical protein [Tunturiibacter lichenicola]|jgi:hypothetical protein|uniref:hypothetical protein n=1 Tax=Tunturiibacter lichenicola TaxID=2051959 RepID=UPI003D9BB4D7
MIADGEMGGARVDRWEAEFKAYASTSHPWPFTKSIEFVGAISRWIKALLPLIGALLLFIGADTTSRFYVHLAIIE